MSLCIEDEGLGRFRWILGSFMPVVTSRSFQDLLAGGFKGLFWETSMPWFLCGRRCLGFASSDEMESHLLPNLVSLCFGRRVD